MCTCFSRSFDKTDRSDIGWICFIRRIWKRNHFGFFKLRRKKVFSMHKLKTYVNDSIMCGNDNFSSWLLIPSRPDDFLFSSLDMYLPSSETERYGMTNGSYPLVVVFCINHVEDLSTHIHLFLVLLMILTQTGNDY